MGWKENISGALGGAIIVVTTVFQPQTEAFANSLFPDAGYYIVRALFYFAVFFVAVVVIHSIYTWNKHRRGLRTSIGHLEGELKGGQLTVGEAGAKRSYGVHAKGKGTTIKELDKVKVISEGQPATGVELEDQAQIGKIGEVEVKHKKHGFWSRVLDFFSSFRGD